MLGYDRHTLCGCVIQKHTHMHAHTHTHTYMDTHRERHNHKDIQHIIVT